MFLVGTSLGKLKRLCYVIQRESTSHPLRSYATLHVKTEACPGIARNQSINNCFARTGLVLEDLILFTFYKLTQKDWHLGKALQ